MPPIPSVPPADATLAELYTPKLITVLREGYGLPRLRADALAGLTVAIVALPLSMAIAIASGMSPAQGLVTAIIGGFIVSALGGSRFQIGGPAGAFIVLVAATVAEHGVEGVVLATLMAGAMLMVAGWLRLGTFVKFIPFPVTVGFTAGIAVIIFASQIRELLGLTLDHEPGPLVEKLPALWAALPTWSPGAAAISLGTVAVILLMRRLLPRWPGMLAAVALATFAAWAWVPEAATIGSRFGGIPDRLPAPHLPDLTWAKVWAVLPAAMSFALLGAIESLLSAVVADGMSGRRHRSNAELVAQGAANLGSAMFGGFCVTGTIARTATNVRAGATGPVSGIMHSAYLLAFMLLAGPALDLIPLAALAGVLAVVSWNMVERPAIVALFRSGRAEAAVLVVTFGLTIFRDLSEAIVVGFLLGSVLFIHRMSRMAEVSAEAPLVPADRPDSGESYDAATAADPEVVVYHLRGALFFGAAAGIGAVLDRIQSHHKALVLDLAGVPFLDSSGANMIEGLAVKARRQGVRLYIAAATPQARRALKALGLRPPAVIFSPSAEAALAAFRR